MTPEQKAERAASARDILNSPILKEAIQQLKDEQVAILVQAPIGDLTATTAHATIKALEGLKGKLETFQFDDRVSRRLGRG